jgi:hypothetical protein
MISDLQPRRRVGVYCYRGLTEKLENIEKELSVKRQKFLVWQEYLSTPT